jgi:hypothetical protein
MSPHSRQGSHLLSQVALSGTPLTGDQLGALVVDKMFRQF